MTTVVLNQKNMKGNVRRPPTSIFGSKWKCRESKHSITTLLSLWLPVFLLWRDTSALAIAIPRAPRTIVTGSSLTNSDMILYDDFLLGGSKLDSREGGGLSEAHDDDSEDDQETAGLAQLGSRVGMNHPKMKKGLSYLTKYYTEAILNSNNNNDNGSGAVLDNFFSSSTGRGSNTSASGEQRIPASIRRKLSFSPPMTSHSLLMTPWSRVSLTGRQHKMRLRWGK